MLVIDKCKHEKHGSLVFIRLGLNPEFISTSVSDNGSIEIITLTFKLVAISAVHKPCKYSYTYHHCKSQLLHLKSELVTSTAITPSGVAMKLMMMMRQHVFGWNLGN